MLVMSGDMAPGQYDHELKTWPEHFEKLWQRIKTYEVRKDDREPRYAVGQVLWLREWVPNLDHIMENALSQKDVIEPVEGTYTARSMRVVVVNMTDPEDHVDLGISPGHVVLGVNPLAYYKKRLDYFETFTPPAPLPAAFPPPDVWAAQRRINGLGESVAEVEPGRNVQSLPVCRQVFDYLARQAATHGLVDLPARMDEVEALVLGTRGGVSIHKGQGAPRLVTSEDKSGPLEEAPGPLATVIGALTGETPQEIVDRLSGQLVANHEATKAAIDKEEPLFMATLLTNGEEDALAYFMGPAGDKMRAGVRAAMDRAERMDKHAAKDEPTYSPKPERGPIRQTHTYVTMLISPGSWDEIAGILREAAYDHCFIKSQSLGTLLCWGGIALERHHEEPAKVISLSPDAYQELRAKLEDQGMGFVIQSDSNTEEEGLDLGMVKIASDPEPPMRNYPIDQDPNVEGVDWDANVIESPLQPQDISSSMDDTRTIVSPGGAITGGSGNPPGYRPGERMDAETIQAMENNDRAEVEGGSDLPDRDMANDGMGHYP